MLRTFAEVLDICNGRNQKKVENPNGKYPIYGSGGIMGYADEFICPNNTVLIGRKGSINNPIFVDTPLWNVDTAFGLVAKQGVLLPKYLYYFCVHFDFEKLNTTVTIPSLTKANLLKIQMPVPDVSEQRTIVSTLDKLQSIITHRKQQLLKLDELVKARFVEMFGTMPQNEKGWETGKIRDIVSEVRYGSSRKAAEGDSGRYPYLRMNNITYGGELDLTDTKTIDVPEDELPKCSVKRGDVLFNRTNSRELVGKTCVYNRDELMVLAGFVVRVRVNEKVTPEFLSAFLNTDFSKRMLLSMCKEAIGQANINAQELQGIAIYIPPLELQKQFTEFLERINKSKVAVQKALDEAQLLFDSLMQEYFG